MARAAKGIVVDAAITVAAMVVAVVVVMVAAAVEVDRGRSKILRHFISF